MPSSRRGAVGPNGSSMNVNVSNIGDSSTLGGQNMRSFGKNKN
jgi:hypothetical protein